MFSRQRLFSEPNSSREHGMIALEVVLGLPGLLLAILLWCEICFVGYISAILDYTIAETSRSVRAYPYKNYAQEFTRTVNSNNAFWHHFIDTDKLIMKASYQRDLGMLNESHCRDNKQNTLCYSSNQEGSLIAVYQVSYHYRPLFSRFTFGHMQPPVMKREVIAVQEYER